MAMLQWGSLGTRNQAFIVAALLVLAAIILFAFIGKEETEESGLKYDDIFASEEELAAEERKVADLAIMQEVDDEGRPTERAKLKVLESLRAQ